MLIRDAEQKDFEALHRLMEQLHGLHVRNRPDIYRNSDPFEESEFTALRNDPEKICLAAELEGTVAGLCIAALKRSENPLVLPRAVAFLDALCVDEACRRGGVGKALFREAERRAREMGAESLELMVWSFNRGASDFYDKMGMTPRSVILEKKL